MNTLVVYASLFGNTQKIADAIAETVEEAGPTRLIDIKELTAADLSDIDLLVMGCPVHNANVPRDVRDAIRALPKRSLSGVKMATFDTRYVESNPAFNAAAPKLAARLRRLGGTLIATPEAFYIEKSHEGPLIKGEIERAEAWATSLVEKAQAA